MSNRAKLPKLHYFYYKGELHKKIRINRSADIVTAWSYPQGRAVQHQYSDVRKNGSKAWTTREVCKMVNRTRNVIDVAIREGMVPAPQMTYGIDENRNPYAWMWSEKDIMNLHDYLLTVHKGRPRKDGLIVPHAMPSKAELRAMMRQDTVFYVQTADGEFVPTWEATTF